MHSVFYLYYKILTRSKKDLLLSFASLCIGIFLFSSIFIITKSANDYFYSESSSLIGGDIKLRSNNLIDLSAEIKSLIENRSVITSDEINAQILIRDASGNRSTAVAMRALDNNYPLYGEVKIQEGIYKNSTNLIYLEQSAMDTIGTVSGDTVYIGDKSFVIGGVIADEPDKISSGFSFTPRALMNIDDWYSLGIDSGNARVSYKTGFKVLADNKRPIIDTLTTFATENNIRYDSSVDGPNNLLLGFKSISTFTGIAISISLFLVYVNIVSNLTLLLSRFRKSIALFKVFGLNNIRLYAIYTMVFSTLATASGLIGSTLAIVACSKALVYANEYFGIELAMSSISFTVLFSLLFSIMLILLSALPFLQAVAQLQPKTLLNSYGENTMKKKNVLYYLGVPILLFVSMYILSGELIVSLYNIGGLVILFLFYYFVTQIIIHALYTVRARFDLSSFSVIAFLKWRSFETYIIGASIMTALSGVFIVTTIKENIELNINQNINTNIPALYIVNITESQISGVQDIIKDNKYDIYSIIRGRLISIGDRVISDKDSGEYTREFNLTYRDTLIDGEEIVSGVWHGSDTSRPQVSIDQEFASGLGAKLGDEVEIFVQGITVKANITSIRKTNQTAGTPFFYLVYSDNILDKFPKNYFITAQLSDDKVISVERDLAINYPNIIPINTKDVISKVNTVLESIINLVSVIGWPSIILGLMLTTIMTVASISSRLRDLLTMIVIGMKRKVLNRILIIESLSLLAISGLISYIIAHVTFIVVNHFAFNFKLFTLAMSPIYTLLGLIIVLFIFTYVYIFSVLRKPLKSLLSDRG